VCVDCGEKVVPPPPTIGVQNFLERTLGLPEGTYKKMSRLRNNIIHGNDDLSQIRAEVDRCVPIISEGLYRAILFVTNCKDWKTSNFPKLLKAEEYWIKISTKLSGFNPQDVERDGYEPHYEIANKLGGVEDQGTLLSANGRMALSPKFNSNTSDGEIAVEIWGNNPEMKAQMRKED